ncbi:MAG: AAA family ATPase, partial [Deltaproteobacteria bacterium]|nr:AAA family ATPase [Deltaproteobacteria bacterium]
MDERVKTWMLPVESLRWSCELDGLGIETTAQIQTLKEKVLAQERAVSAFEFGMGMTGNDYNIFVVGEPRTGMSYLTRSFVQDIAKTQPSPQDWIYVHNFQAPDHPQAVNLPKGLARSVAKDMDELVEALINQIPEAFQSDEYRRRREEPIRQFSIKRNELLALLETKVNADGFILNMSQEGMMIAPAKDGHVITEEDLLTLTDEQKAELRQKSEGPQEEMNQTGQKIRKFENELREKHKELDRRVALHAVGYLIDELQEKYAGLRPVLNYLHDVKNDVIKNLADFKQKEQQPATFPLPKVETDFSRYKVNVLIDNSEVNGAPVIYEINPTYTNLFGAIERRASFGTL